jgi:hypothetical protein
MLKLISAALSVPAVLISFFVLLVLKISGAASLTWFVVCLPLIVGAGFYLTALFVVLTIFAVCGAVVAQAVRKGLIGR